MSSASFRYARVFAATAAGLAFCAVSKRVLFATTQKHQVYAAYFDVLFRPVPKSFAPRNAAGCLAAGLIGLIIWTRLFHGDRGARSVYDIFVLVSQGGDRFGQGRRRHENRESGEFPLFVVRPIRHAPTTGTWGDVDCGNCHRQDARKNSSRRVALHRTATRS
jgi:hypothetical protein